MCIGVGLVGDAGTSAGSDDAISQEEFLGNLDRNGFARVSGYEKKEIVFLRSARFGKT